jgi:hypothetical protein
VNQRIAAHAEAVLALPPQFAILLVLPLAAVTGCWFLACGAGRWRRTGRGGDGVAGRALGGRGPPSV